MNQIWSRSQGHLIALLATTLVVVVGGYSLGEHAMLLFFVVPVVAAWSGGLRAGLFGSAISAVVGPYFFMDHTGLVLAKDNQMRILTYLAVGVFMSWLVESLHVARRRLEDRQERLEREVTVRIAMEKALQDADRRKDEFLATLSHELRNPLTPLSYALQIWSPVNDDRGEMQKLKAVMDRQVHQMTRLIDDLMDVSRITRGKIHLQKQRVDLSTLISGAVEAVGPLVQARGHQLTVTVPSMPSFVNGDVARLTQVFANILHNAVKYTGRNGAIGLVAANQGERAVVTIKDNGPGIPSNMLSIIFEVFSQVDQTLDRCHGGLGIGLMLVKRLVEVHGGSVEARSDGLGKGSEFIVILPLADAETDDQHDAVVTKLATSIPCHRILVVDDVQVSAEILASMLRSIGQETSLATDGLTAIEWARENKPDVVFLDIAMPGMDGYEVARRLRACSELKGLRLVALTGYGQEEDRRKAYEAGLDHHMTKPASFEAVQEFLLTVPVRREHGATGHRT